MKRILILSSFLLLSSFCYSQGFDQEMAKAGKEFHKKSKNAGKTIYKKSKGSQSKANRAKRKNKKRFKNRNLGG
jgi:hypothetical protein